MVDSLSGKSSGFDFKKEKETLKIMNKNICPVSDNYYSQCPVMRSYYYLLEEFFSSWSWSG